MPEVAPYRARSAVALLIAGCAVLFAAWQNAAVESPAPTPAQVAAYYKGSVAPLIDDAARRDREAAGAAMKRLREHFQTFHAGVPAFAEDLTGWGTRFGIVGRSVKDLWTKFWEDSSRATATKDYVNAKFRAHIVSEEKLQHAIADTLAVFRESVAANHNRMIAEVRLAFIMPESPVKVMPPAFNELLAGADTLAAAQGTASVANLGASTAVGGLTGAATTRLIAGLIARLAASTAATIAAEGSAAAGATATGGAAGTAAGPVGTVIGIGVGIVVGGIMDWWMTDSFKTRLHEQCGSFLTNLERDIVHGTAGSPGLRKTLEDAAAANHAAFRTALEHSLTLP